MDIVRLLILVLLSGKTNIFLRRSNVAGWILSRRCTLDLLTLNSKSFRVAKFYIRNNEWTNCSNVLRGQRDRINVMFIDSS